MDLMYLMKREMFRRKYSVETIKAYADNVNKFLRYIQKEPRQITKQDVKDYLYHLADKNLSGSTLNQNLQAIKFALEEILNKRLYFVKLPYSKLPKTKPTVLTKEEVKKLLSVIENPTHNLMIKLMYSAGLRVKELVRLKVEDLHFEDKIGWVRKGKGNKDRLFILANKIKPRVLEHIQQNNLTHGNYLFKGRKGHITVKSIQEIVKQASKKAGLQKNIHPHTLRHSFATHLIENGYDVVSVQSLLGHSSVETTMVYVHLCSPKMISIKSPIDD